MGARLFAFNLAPYGYLTGMTLGKLVMLGQNGPDLLHLEQVVPQRVVCLRFGSFGTFARPLVAAANVVP
jgi:hypothetical protein